MQLLPNSRFSPPAAASIVATIFLLQLPRFGLASSCVFAAPAAALFTCHVRDFCTHVAAAAAPVFLQLLLGQAKLNLHACKATSPESES